MSIKVLVWDENEHKSEAVAKVYPDGLHGCIAQALAVDGDIETSTATFQEPEHGLTVDRLAQTDVLVWWGHKVHDQIADEIVERVVERVWSGMGFIALHSSHFSKPFKRLMGSSCNLCWREAGERERLWVVNPRHEIAAGLPSSFTLDNEEMYGEPFGIPEPLETVFISWFQGGEVFRSGVTYRRGAGKIFYFRPGHETYPTFHNKNVGQLLRNAARWAHNPQPVYQTYKDAPNVPVDQAPEPITQRDS